jgi:hypothetical protein
MQGPLLRFPATCPECALESLVQLPVAVVADQLRTGRNIRLYARCHDKYWTATFLEREQLREYLAAVNAAALPCARTSERSSDFEAAMTARHNR